jgi:hypothetical protein
MAIRSAGAFNTASTTFDLQQEWSNAGAAAFPVTNMSLQRVQVDQLALLVLPSQSVLGSFSIDSAFVTQSTPSGLTTFGNGTVAGTLSASSSGTTCLFNGSLNQTQLIPAVEPQLTFGANICSQPQLDAGGNPNGLQEITVSFEQSLQSTIVSPLAQYLFQPGSTVSVRIVMSFVLTGSTYRDRVSATVKIPVPAAGTSGLADGVTGLQAWYLQPITGVTVTSP